MASWEAFSLVFYPMGLVSTPLMLLSPYTWYDIEIRFIMVYSYFNCHYLFYFPCLWSRGSAIDACWLLLQYMDKPPRGKHSTKGLGKTVPLESEFVKWRDDVVVPCGKPVPSSIRSSELMYNEYIVYNTSQVQKCSLPYAFALAVLELIGDGHWPFMKLCYQVKMQFLLKVRFHHKRWLRD